MSLRAGPAPVDDGSFHGDNDDTYNENDDPTQNLNDGDDDDDEDFEDDEETTNSGGKKKRKTVTGRQLMRWDADKDQLLLLTVESVCAKRGMAIPWDVIAAQVRPGLTVEAVKQHMTKVYNTRVEHGFQVPVRVDKGSAALAAKAKTVYDGKDPTAMPGKNANLLHFPFSTVKKNTKKAGALDSTPKKVSASGDAAATPKKSDKPYTPKGTSARVKRVLEGVIHSNATAEPVVTPSKSSGKRGRPRKQVARSASRGSSTGSPTKKKKTVGVAAQKTSRRSKATINYQEPGESEDEGGATLETADNGDEEEHGEEDDETVNKYDSGVGETPEYNQNSLVMLAMSTPTTFASTMPNLTAHPAFSTRSTPSYTFDPLYDGTNIAGLPRGTIVQNNTYGGTIGNTAYGNDAYNGNVGNNGAAMQLTNPSQSSSMITGVPSYGYFHPTGLNNHPGPMADPPPAYTSSPPSIGNLNTTNNLHQTMGGYGGFGNGHANTPNNTFINPMPANNNSFGTGQSNTTPNTMADFMNTGYVRNTSVSAPNNIPRQFSNPNNLPAYDDINYDLPALTSGNSSFDSQATTLVNNSQHNAQSNDPMLPNLTINGENALEELNFGFGYQAQDYGVDSF